MLLHRLPEFRWGPGFFGRGGHWKGEISHEGELWEIFSVTSYKYVIYIYIYIEIINIINIIEIIYYIDIYNIYLCFIYV